MIGNQRGGDLVKWLPPPMEWFKPNVDGAYDQSSGMMSAGGLIRDCNGQWVKGFQANLGDSNSGRTLESLDWVESGLVLTTCSFQKKNLLLSGVWTCELSHTWREGNQCADLLASGTLEVDLGFGELDSTPPTLHKLLRDDLLSCVFRSCS